MGQAFDGDGNVLGEASGATKREVFEQLQKDHPDADEIRIKSALSRASEAAAGEKSDAPRAPRPSLGRIVLYAPDTSDPAHNGAAQLPAVIVAVHSDICVNLKVLNDGDHDFWKTSVLQGTGPFRWSWPPRV